MPRLGRRDEIDSEAVLELLEDDQLVSAKESVHLGRRNFSPAMNATLWGLRVYVVLMLVLIAVEVVHTIAGR